MRIFLFVVLTITLAQGYEIFYMKEIGACNTDAVEINVGSLSRNSSGILKNSIDRSFKPGMKCTVFLRPPLSYGIILSIRSINLLPPALEDEECENYLEIFPVEMQGSVRLCGYSFDGFEFQSYSHLNGMRVSFYTSNTTRQQSASFQLTFTSFRKENTFCSNSEKHCRNRNCIWKGLMCDGHNNCGDLSDEFDKRISQCSLLSPGESLGVILGTIAGSLILLIIVAYLRGPKITRQIERLSARSRLSPGNTSIQTDSSVNAVPVINRVRSNYGSTSRFLSSYEYQGAVYPDPPPRYEDIAYMSNASRVSVTTPQVSVTNHQISGTTSQVSVNNPSSVSVTTPQLHISTPQRSTNFLQTSDLNYLNPPQTQGNALLENQSHSGNNYDDNNPHGS